MRLNCRLVKVGVCAPRGRARAPHLTRPISAPDTFSLEVYVLDFSDVASGVRTPEATIHDVLWATPVSLCRDSTPSPVQDQSHLPSKNFRAISAPVYSPSAVFAALWIRMSLRVRPEVSLYQFMLAPTRHTSRRM